METQFKVIIFEQLLDFTMNAVGISSTETTILKAEAFCWTTFVWTHVEGRSSALLETGLADLKTCMLISLNEIVIWFTAVRVLEVNMKCLISHIAFLHYLRCCATVIHGYNWCCSHWCENWVMYLVGSERWKIQVLLHCICRNIFQGIFQTTFCMICKCKYIASSPFFDVKSPTGILKTNACHVDLFQFLETNLFILIGLVGRSSPEILPKNERGKPGFSVNTTVVQQISVSLLHLHNQCRDLSCWGSLMLSLSCVGVFLWKIMLSVTFLQRHLCLTWG